MNALILFAKSSNELLGSPGTYYPCGVSIVSMFFRLWGHSKRFSFFLIPRYIPACHVNQQVSRTNKFPLTPYSRSIYSSHPASLLFKTLGSSSSLGGRTSLQFRIVGHTFCRHSSIGLPSALHASFTKTMHADSSFHYSVNYKQYTNETCL